MSAEESKETSLRRRQINDGFDEVAKGLAAGTISRRRALKLTAAAIVGSSGLLALFPGFAGAQDTGEGTPLNVTVVGQGGCKEGEPAISNRSCRANQCGSKQMCLCAKTVSGSKRCVNVLNAECPRRDECDSNRDCPGDRICIQAGGCCGHPRRNKCLRPC